MCSCVSTIFTEPELAGYLAVGLPKALLQSFASLNAEDGYGGSLVYRRVAHLMMPNDPHRNGQLLIHAARDRDPKFFAAFMSALGEGPDEDPVYGELLAGSEVGWVVGEAIGIATCGIGGEPIVVLVERSGELVVCAAVDKVEIRRLQALQRESPIGAAVAAIDGKPVVVSCDTGGAVHARSLETGKQILEIPTKSPAAPHVLTIIETTRQPIIVYGIRHDLEVRRWPSGTEIDLDLSYLRGGARALTAGIVNGSDALLVSDGEDNLHCWDLGSGDPVTIPWNLNGREIYALAMRADDGDTADLFVGDAHGSVNGYSGSGRQTGEFLGQVTPVVALYAGRWRGKDVLASASREGRVVVWDLATAEAMP